MFRRYKTPNGSWLGWFEDEDGTCTGFVDVSGHIHAWDAESETLTPIES